MRISVKTGGRLGRFLPPGSEKNLGTVEVASDATPADVIKQLGMPEDGSYLVILNGTSLPKAERSRQALAENDTLAIMPPLKGG